MDKIKILYYGLSTHLGGIETYLRKIYDNIDKSLFEISFIKMSDKVYFEDYFIEGGAKFYQVCSRKNPIKHIREIQKLLQENKFDIVHINNNTMSYVELALIALQQNCKVIMHSRSSSNAGGKITMILHYLNRIYTRNKPMRRIAVSQKAGNWLFGSDVNFEVYPNGVDIDRFGYNEKFRNEIRTKFNLSDDDIILGHIGRLAYPKNQNFLIKLMTDLLVLNPRYKLMFVGEGTDGIYLRKLSNQLHLSDSVIFVGNQKQTEQFLSAFDIFLFPSFFEGYPNAVLEAETSGLPAVISNVLAPEVIVGDNTFPIPLVHQQWIDTVASIQKNTNRNSAIESVKRAQLDIKSEISRLESLYIKIIDDKKTFKKI